MKNNIRIFFLMSCALSLSADLPKVNSFEEAIFSEHHGPFSEGFQLTEGPEGHWFGYYDKWQFDPTGRYVLGMKVDFDERSPVPDDVLKIGMIDLQNENKWIPLGETRAWGWQQGCMLQWLPASEDEIMWNDREGDRFVARVVNVKTGEARVLPRAVYHVSPDGKWGLSMDFERVEHVRRGYGYAGVEDRTQDEKAPADAGIYLVNMQTGDSKLIITIADVVSIPYSPAHPEDKHWFNHIAWNTDGSRFMFLHRWRPGEPQVRQFLTRAFTADADGENLRILSEKPGLSHFEWRDPETMLFYREEIRAYVLISDDGSEEETLVFEGENGHCRFLPDTDWILTDTYPQGDEHLQYLYLYHIPTGRLVVVNAFYKPRSHVWKEWRVDLHPRLSQDGTRVVVDSMHKDGVRQMFLVDLSDAKAEGRGVIYQAPADGASGSSSRKEPRE